MSIKLVDTGAEFPLDQIRSHYLSLAAHLLISIMKNEHPMEVVTSIRLIYPHMPMVRKLFTIVQDDGKDLSSEVFEFIENLYVSLEKDGAFKDSSTPPQAA